jgi:hypothetical protein
VERAPKAAKPGKRKERKCGQCGRPGHIARHCPGIGVKETAAPMAAGKVLTEDQFDELKDAKRDGVLSTKVFELRVLLEAVESIYKDSFL